MGDTTRMLSRITPPVIERALRSVEPPLPFPPAADRAAWGEIRAAIGDRADAIITQAEADRAAPLPEGITATLYLDFLRTGQRYRYQAPVDRRRAMLRNMVLAECLEGRQRYLDPLLDLVWAICEESSWARPAHQKELTDMDAPFVDLSAAETALELAETDLLLGDQLHPALGKRIRYEINRRCFVPYLARHDHHWMFNVGDSQVNNWAAVCSAGVVGAALHLLRDEPARLADLIHRAFTSMDDFLAGFDADGGTSEGPFCWSYGVGYYTILAQLVEHYTAGAVSLWTAHACTIARFPLRSELSPNRVAHFSDCNIDFSHIPAQLAYLARRLDDPDLMAMAQRLPSNFREERLPWGVRSLVWRPDPTPLPDFVPARHDWFRGLQWMIARVDPADPDALVLAAKGGHNGEMHNHNDIGHLIVHVKGESVLTDLGRGQFNRAYFAEGRYGFLVNSSQGHSVPVVNGHYQAAGQAHAAHLLEHSHAADGDLLKLDLAAAYPPEAKLERLERTIALDRRSPGGRVELLDEAVCSVPSQVESVLVTFGEVDINPQEAAVTLRGEQGALRVRYDATLLHAWVETEHAVPLHSGPVDVRRVIFAPHEVAQQVTIRLHIEPVGSSA